MYIHKRAGVCYWYMYMYLEVQYLPLTALPPSFPPSLPRCPYGILNRRKLWSLLACCSLPPAKPSYGACSQEQFRYRQSDVYISIVIILHTHLALGPHAFAHRGAHTFCTQTTCVGPRTHAFCTQSVQWYLHA